MTDLIRTPEGAKPIGPDVPGGHEVPDSDPDVELALAHESGVSVKPRSQWYYVRTRFLRHRLAVASLVVLVLLVLLAIFAERVSPYAYDELDLFNIAQPPTREGHHWFGTDLLGRDYLSRVIYGLRTSLWVAFLVAGLTTLIGTTIGSIAGYYGGKVDNLLMRFTDLVLTLPTLAVLLTASVFLGNGDPVRVGVILALLFWTGLARIVRGVFLSLREKEFIEAAKAAGAGDGRIILRHLLPNAIGPIIVAMTLIIAAAILVEAALSFLGFGIQPPTPALGKLIADGQTQGLDSWWLVTFPGVVIVIIALAVNFIGDGLRDALDPTQRRIRA
jgi:ABC-type dipeptide/oligopeptide/nickel transport system permease subunit